MKRSIQKEQYFKVFIIGFSIMALCFVPFLIMDKGLFVYLGDYNAQQIPFYQMIHDAVRNGNIFWNWQTDLGANTIASYSFYLLGSPFFWLTIPFPSDWVPYLMPFIMCIKYGVATLTSYAYLRRFVKDKNVATLGAILYAFSGFSAYNIFFNHFHDAICIFPLILLALEESVVDNKKGRFALCIALSTLTNYYFLAGQVTFLILYFIARLIFSDDFKINLSKFLSLAFESVIGVGIASIVLFPTVYIITQNPRVNKSSVLLGYRMLYYGYGYEYLNIIQSMFFVPDIPSSPNFFTSIKDKWSSVAVYLPLFSMVGVFAFFNKFKKHWIKVLLLLSALFAFVPILNSSFQMLNGQFYARWYYMPILIMALASAVFIDKHGFDLKFGIGVTAFITVAFSLIGILPSYVDNENGESVLTFGALPESKIRFWLTVMLSMCALIVVTFIFKYRKSEKIIKVALLLTCVFAFGGNIMMMGFCRSHGPSTYTITDDALYQEFESLSSPDEQFYRIDDYNCLSNSNMYWGYSSMQSFHSIIPKSCFDFYKSMDISRVVKTDIDYSYYSLRGLTSVKYSISDVESKKTYEDMPGFVHIADEGHFAIYENEYFVPMGFMYDEYFDDSQLESIKKENVNKLYMHGLYLTDAQIQKYSEFIKPLPKIRDYQLTKDAYLSACTRLQKTACSYFKYDNYGFTAKANTGKAGLMVFSVPYEEGWSATVNDESVSVENVQNGFMAVLVPKGEVNIRFTYKTPYLNLGIIISAVCVLLLILYFIFWKLVRKNNKQKISNYTED